MDPSARATASKIGKWLVERNRLDEALQIFVAGAVAGPNDLEGQQLLAEALRLNAGSELAKQAFERMEGVKGDHSALDQAIARFDLDTMAKFEREMAPASFRRAQVGFNNNVKYKAAVYHVQTEDSGLDKPHIITHLFADGGRVIKSHKRNYAKEVSRTDITHYVRALMKGQQMEMLLMLRDGRFDAIVEGKAMGGMSVLETEPEANVKQLTRKKQGEGAPAVSPSILPPPPSVATPVASQAATKLVSTTVARAPMASSAETKRVLATLQVQRSLSGGPEQYPIFDDETIIGAAGGVGLPGERFCHPREAALRWRDSRLWLEDLDGGNGAFLRIRSRVELNVGDEFIIGDQLFRIERNRLADDEPAEGPTYFYSSPKWPSAFRVVQIFERGAVGACAVLKGGMVNIGSGACDITVHDALVSEQHCSLEEQAQVVVLTDLGSRTGVFVRLQGEAELVHGDELIIGRTRLLVDVGAQNALTG
jgi:Inner membrane component of T3SS, cytoplasmic domain